MPGKLDFRPVSWWRRSSCPAIIGTMYPDSDLVLLIVMPDGIHRRKTSVEIYKALKGIGVSKDVIVVTEFL